MKDVKLKDLLGLPILSLVCLYERKSDSIIDIHTAKLIKGKQNIPLGNIAIMGYEDYRVLSITAGEKGTIDIAVCKDDKQVTDDLIVYKSIGLIADVVCDLVKELKQENLNIVVENKIEGLEKIMSKMQYKISNFSTKDRSE